MNQTLNTSAQRRKPALHQYKPLNKVEDGIAHLNVGAAATTSLGEALSLTTNTELNHPFLGRFRTHEGYRHFLLYEQPNDNFRYVFGSTRVAVPKSVQKISRTHYHRLVIDGYYLKITQNPALYELFLANTLPFEQYYIVPISNLAVNHSTAPWHIEGLNLIREHLRQSAPYELVTYEDYQLIKR